MRGYKSLRPCLKTDGKSVGASVSGVRMSYIKIKNKNKQLRESVCVCVCVSVNVCVCVRERE